MKKPTITICCVCEKIKVKNRAGEIVWIARGDAVMPKYDYAMETAVISHGYCHPCMESELVRQEVK